MEMLNQHPGYDGYMEKTMVHDGHGYGHGTGDIYGNGSGSGYACGYCDSSGICFTSIYGTDSSEATGHEQGLGLGVGSPYGSGWG